MITKLTRLALAAGIVASASACGSSIHGHAASSHAIQSENATKSSGIGHRLADRQVHKQVRPIIEGSFVQAYASLPEVVRHSSLVVIATVSPVHKLVPADEKGSGPIKATVTPVRAESVLKGTMKPGKVIQLRQLGDSSDSLPDDWSIVRPGTYVLFLGQFEFHRGHPLSQYVPLAVYSKVTNTNWERAGDYPTLPKTITSTELVRLI